jgi:hypothetical protein
MVTGVEKVCMHSQEYFLYSAKVKMAAVKMPVVCLGFMGISKESFDGWP